MTIAGKPTMNEDVFPIEHGGFSNVMLVFRGVSSFTVRVSIPLLNPGPPTQ